MSYNRSTTPTSYPHSHTHSHNQGHTHDYGHTHNHGHTHTTSLAQQPVYQSQVYGQQPAYTNTYSDPYTTTQQQQTLQGGHQTQYLGTQQGQVLYNQAYKGESRIEANPKYRTAIEYETVPVERTYVDQEVIEYQTEYIPRVEYDTYVDQVPVKSIEYVPVQRIEYVPREKIDYVPQERKVERIEYDSRVVPVNRGVQQSNMAVSQSQIGQPTDITQSSVQYQPQYYQPSLQQNYNYSSQYGYAPSSGARAYATTTTAKEAVKPEKK